MLGSFQEVRVTPNLEELIPKSQEDASLRKINSNRPVIGSRA
jgi:hypothetical protein